MKLFKMKFHFGLINFIISQFFSCLKTQNWNNFKFMDIVYAAISNCLKSISKYLQISRVFLN